MYDMEVYDFEFYRNSAEKKTPKDERVSVTIVSVLDHFFINSSRLLMYVCDSGDGRGRERQALFKKLQDNLSDINRDEIEISLEFEEKIETIYGGILTRKNLNIWTF